MSIPAASLVAEIGVDGEVAAAAKLDAFGARVTETAAKQVTAASRVGSAFAAVDHQLGSFGLPFGGALAAMSSKLDAGKIHAGSFGQTLANLGQREAQAAALGLVAVGVEAVHFSDQLETSHAQLETSIKNAGEAWADEAGKVAKTDDAMEKLGFTHAQTESSVASLVRVTKDAGKATDLEGLAADISRAKHVDLATATSALVRVEGGRYAQAARLLQLSKEQVAGMTSERAAVKELTDLFGGQGAAFAQTFAGQLQVLRAEGEDLGASLGQSVVPQIIRFANDGITVVHTVQDVNSALGGWVGKTAELAAIVPVGYYAVTKLGAAGKAIGEAYTAGARALGLSTAATDANAVSQGANAAATTTGTAAQLGQLSATDAVALAQARLTLAQEAEALAVVDVTTATDAFNAVLADETAVSAAVVAADDARTAALGRLAVAQDAVTAGEAGVAGAGIAAGAGLGAAGAGASSILSTLIEVIPELAALATGIVAIEYAAHHNGGFTNWIAETFPGTQALHIPGVELPKSPGATEGEKAGQQFAQSLTVTADAAQKMGLSVSNAQTEVAQYSVSQLQGAKVGDEWAKVTVKGAAAAHENGDALVEYTSGIDDVTESLSPAQKATLALSIAQKQYADDLAAGHVPAAQLARDKENLATATAAESRMQAAANSAAIGATQTSGALRDAIANLRTDIDAGHPTRDQLATDWKAVEGAADGSAASQQALIGIMQQGGAEAIIAAGGVLSLAQAYELLGQADPSNAISSSNNLASAAFANSDAQDAVTNATTAYHQAIDGVTKAQGAAGGSTKNATAAALDQTGKELGLRDALRAVGTATTGVEDAQVNLIQAQNANTAAATTLRTAEENYRETLRGVSADSAKAKAALDALTQARVDANEQSLNVGDAQRNLDKARNDAQLGGFAVTDAERTLAASRAASTAGQAAVVAAELQLANVRKTTPNDTAAIANAETALLAARAAEAPLHEQMVKDEVALKDARIDATAGDEAIKRAEDALTSSRLQAKQKTSDLNAAERTYHDTLHGFPANSAEAKAAQQQLTDAQLAARQAVDGLIHAQQGLQAATDQTTTAAYNLRRAQADVNGELNKTSGAAGGAVAAFDTVQSKMEKVKAAAKALAEDTRLAVTQSTGSVARGILAEVQALEQVSATEPLLKGAFADALHNLSLELNAMAVAGTAALQQIIDAGALPTAGIGGETNVSLAPPTHATGGTIRPGERGLVGDAGTELVEGLPGGGARVYTHAETIRMVPGVETASTAPDTLAAPPSRLEQTFTHIETRDYPASTFSGAAAVDLRPLLAEIRALRTDLQNAPKPRGGVHIDTLNARDDHDVARVLEEQMQREYMLAAF